MPTPVEARPFVASVVEHEMPRLPLHDPCLVVIGGVASVVEEEVFRALCGVHRVTLGLVGHHAHEYDSKSSKFKTLSHKKRKKSKKSDIFSTLFPEIIPNLCFLDIFCGFCLKTQKTSNWKEPPKRIFGRFTCVLS